MTRSRNRLVEATGPALAVQEILYGFIMGLIFVTAARLGFLTDKTGVELVFTIMCMNATWGAIDAVVFFIIDVFSEKSHIIQINRGKTGEWDREETIAYLINAFAGTPLDALNPEDERRICEQIIECRTEDSEGVRRDRREMAYSAIGCFIITVLTVIPIAIPILLIPDNALALTTSSVLSAIILFFVGYRMKKYYSVNGLVLGLFLMGVGLFITVVATFTGG